MALSEELPLYRDTYRLLNNLLILTQDFPRFLPLQYGQPYGGFDFGYAFSDFTRRTAAMKKVGVLTEFLDRYRMLQMLFPRMCGAEGHYRAQIRLVRAAVGEDRQAGYELETI